MKVFRLILLLVLLVGCLLPAKPVLAADPNWWDTDWCCRKQLLFDNSASTENLTDFPVLVHLTSSRIDYSLVQDAGQDLRFIDADNVTVLDHEIEEWNESGNSTVWVEVPQIDATSNQTDYIWMYYGNPTAADGQDVEGTWGASAYFVSHMKDDPDNQHIKDSSFYGSDGTKVAANRPIESTGEIATYAQDFDSANPDYITIPANQTQLNFTSENFSIIARIRVDSVVTHPVIFIRGLHNADGYRLHIKNDGALRFDTYQLLGRQTTEIAAGGIALATWYTVGMSRNGASVWLYIDGIDATLVVGVHVNPLTCGRTAKIGIYDDLAGLALDGKMEFLHIYGDVALSTDWMEAQHLSMTDAFITYVGDALTVETYNAEVNSSGNLSANLSGAITSITTPCGHTRGFVWDTATHGDPGDVSPATSNYTDNWTEEGCFSADNFTYITDALTELTTYYYRAVARDCNGWVYGNEITFFVGEEGKIYLELRPDLDETKIRGQAGIPSDVFVGQFNGYSLPIFASDNEQLNYIICVPDRWDGESDILMHIDSCLSVGNEADRSNRWEILWESFTPNEDIVPATSNAIYNQRYIYSNDQYQSYQDWLVIDYDIDPLDPIVADDLIAITLRRVTVAPKETDANEIIVFAVDILFARGDLLGDVTTLNWIENLILVIGGDVEMIPEIMFLGFVGIFALGLMILALAWKRVSFAWAAGGAWIIMGVFSYTLSTATWDVYYTLFWLGVGLLLVAIFEGMALRGMTKQEEQDDIGEQDATDRFIDQQERYNDKADRLNEAMSSPSDRRRKRRETPQKGKDNT